MQIVRLWCAVIALSLPCAAQDAIGPRDVYVWEQLSYDRWLQSGQRHMSVPFRPMRTFTRLVPDAAGSAAQMVFRAEFELGYRPFGPDSVRFVLAPDGGFVSAAALARPPFVPAGHNSSDSLYLAMRVNYISIPVRWFLMPAARVWDIVPVVRAARPQPGLRWVDTLGLAAVDGDHRQSLTGVRTSRVLGDTLVDGQLLWRIADSADATIVERFFEDEISYGPQVMIERTVRGTIRSHYLYDPALRLARVRVDTAALSGTATLRYPDGRSFTTPTRFDRIRESRLHPLRALAARVAALRLAPEVTTDQGPGRGAGGVAPDLTRRMAAGDPGLMDSLAGVFARASHPVELQRANFPSWGAGAVSPLALRINADLIRAGDTATLVRDLLGRPQQWDIPALRDLLIPIAANPAAAFARGIPRDLFYATAVRRIIVNPPVLVRDTSAWGFSPAILDFLAEQGRTAVETRLRDLGLLALYARNPRRYADSVLTRARAGIPVLEEAALLARGVGRANPRAPKTAVPDSGAAWRQWYTWIGEPSGPVPQPPVVPLILRSVPAQRGGGAGRVPLGESHARALAVYEVQRGRQIVDELRRELASATEDSARVLFTAMLEGLGANAIDANVLAAQFRSGDEGEIARARAQLRTIFGAGRGAGVGPRVINAMPSAPDSLTRAQITDRLVAIALGAGPVWPTVEQRVRGVPGPGVRVEPQRGIVTTVIISDSLPPATIERWRSRATLMSAAEWVRISRTDMRRAYTITGFVQAGPFVNVMLNWSERLPPNPSGMQGHSGNTRFWLMRIDGEWVVVMWTSVAS
jgi:hypothetical protein